MAEIYKPILKIGGFSMNKEIYKLMFKAPTRFAALASVLSNTLDSDKTDSEKLEWLEMVKEAAIESGSEQENNK
jgi:hypothetical protein